MQLIIFIRLLSFLITIFFHFVLSVDSPSSECIDLNWSHLVKIFLEWKFLEFSFVNCIKLIYILADFLILNYRWEQQFSKIYYSWILFVPLKSDRYLNLSWQVSGRFPISLLQFTFLLCDSKCIIDFAKFLFFILYSKI